MTAFKLGYFGSFGSLPIGTQKPDDTGSIRTPNLSLTSLAGCPDVVDGYFNVEKTEN